MMAGELEQVFREDAWSDDVRAVVVTGAGRAFCAGAWTCPPTATCGARRDPPPTPQQFRAAYDRAPYQDGVRDTGGKVTLAIHALPKPVIAAINGPAVGIGATMTLAMDLRLASTRARIGSCSAAPASCRRPRRAGSSPHRGHPAGAGVGLPAGDPRCRHSAGRAAGPQRPRARGPAHRRPGPGPVVRGRPPPSHWGSPRLLLYRNSAAADPPRRTCRLCWRCTGPRSRTAREGVTAFREKRAPRFTGSAADLPGDPLTVESRLRRSSRDF